MRRGTGRRGSAHIFLKKILTYFFWLAVAGLLIHFSVINRQGVSIDFWPFAQSLEVRFFIVVLGSLTVGVLWGGLAGWIANGDARRKAREAVKQAADLKNELRVAQSEATQLKAKLRDSQVKTQNYLSPADAA
ncbi:MAG: hypothetical protein CBB68_10910 [Rhodospirillaceae bacterium TMED8]|nr:hypothetical protein [Magnetovibrio sp.]OUT49917.1 MAG: hypothetical protein CBB68_10910 [Rhodospirillaceae bacterium TMED8]|tara:strand:- start:2578 stop:2976 length:399 start_codon:yes stop_codon:yes gene_type:complete